jgi:glycosyltransferase involved in cell wall biosynthesis
VSEPRVTIGIPVYDGAAYLDEALRSARAQTLPDVEVLVSDNASSDASAAIAERHAADDARVRVVRQPENRGAAWNYNELVRLARAPFFKWLPADDRMAPGHLERCVAALEGRPDAVLAYPRTELIDAQGHVVGTYEDRLALLDDRAWRRAARFVHNVNLCNAVLGVFRTDVLRGTRRIQSFAGADAVLLLEAALRGAVLEVPEALFQRRIHAGASHEANRDRAALERWFDPRRTRRFRLPVRYELLGGYLRAAREAPLPAAARAQAAAAILGTWSARQARVRLGRWRRRLRGERPAGGSGRWSGIG